MTPQQKEKWSKVRRLGQQRYILLYGVLGWGVTTGVVWAIVMSAIGGWDGLIFRLALALITFPLGGYFVGKQMWSRTEKKFQKAEASS